MQLSFDFADETDDLRKAPIEESPASLLAYGAPVAPVRRTAALPRGTQARFIKAAAHAAEMGFPINTLLTIRWDSLFCDNDANRLRPFPTPERIDGLVEHLRKWLCHRSLPPVYFWVREVSKNEGEHWHLAFHLPKLLSPQIIDFIAGQTGEAAATRPPSGNKKTEGEFARSEIGSWHLARDTRPELKGFYLAAYLGKGEPSEVLFRGKMVPNKKKPVRGLAFGGKEKDGKYDAEQGLIIGTPARIDRFFIAKILQRKAKATCENKPRAQFKSPKVTPSRSFRKSPVSEMKSSRHQAMARNESPRKAIQS